jgi:hypothetical protein
MKTITNFTFDNNFNYSFSSIKKSLKRKETKVFALLSHWAAGLVVDIFTFVVLVLSAQYFLSLAVLALIVYYTYAVVGTVQELI